jgi:hypothetical protein
LNKEEPALHKKQLTENEFEKFTKYTESDYILRKHPGFATLAIHAGQKPESVYGYKNVLQLTSSL